MRFSLRILRIVLLLLLLPVIAAADDWIKSADAIGHVGERAKVCGVVATARYAAASRGAPTFLNLDRPYPNQVFTAVIWGADRRRFSPPPETQVGRRVCVTGLIELYRGKPEIVVKEPGHLEVLK